MSKETQDKTQGKHFTFDKSFQEKPFFVYVDWTTEPSPRPFYVGYGGLARIKKKQRNKHHTNIMNKYGFNRKVVLETLDENTAKQAEISLIAEYKTYAFSEACVFGTNYTIGGDGSRGHKQPALSESHKLAIGRANAHPKTKKTKRLMKIAAQKRANDPSWRQKMSQVSKQRWQNAEYQLKFAKATTGKKRTSKQKKKMSDAQRISWENLERHWKHSERLRALWQDPEYREKQLQARKEAK